MGHSIHIPEFQIDPFISLCTGVKGKLSLNYLHVFRKLMVRINYRAS